MRKETLKRITVGLMAALLAMSMFAVAGCGGGQESDSGSSDKAATSQDGSQNAEEGEEDNSCVDDVVLK